jgi:hypothetical protein
MELASAKTLSTTDPLAQWALSKIRLEGRPFSFKGHEYLRAIYDDTSPHVVLSKAAQIGGTTFALLRSLHACLNYLNVIYFFPTRTDVLEFSKSRVRSLIADNPYLSKKMTDTDMAGLKKIGEAYIYFRGMQSTVGMKSVPADMIVFDELDEATPEAKALARERIAHSDYKRIIELSNPSLPDYGVDEQYQASDQRHWTLKCPGCGMWTALEKEFPKKLNDDVKIILPRENGTFYRACPRCSAELDLDIGEWVADFQDRDIHGYRISQLFSAKVDPGEILKEYQTTRFPDRFYNMKIGVPWADLERRLDVMSVLSLCCDGPFPENPRGSTCMGVDTGKELHVVILKRNEENEDEPHQLIHLTKCHDFKDLDKLMDEFEIVRCVIDGLPETHSARAFAKRFPCQVYLNFFNENQRGSAKWDDNEYKVEINRTEALDSSRAAIREKRVVLPRRTSIIEEFARHLAADAKVLDENENTGAKKYRYIRTGENHFSMAFTYAWTAIHEIWMPRIWFV